MKETAGQQGHQTLCCILTSHGKRRSFLCCGVVWKRDNDLFLPITLFVMFMILSSWPKHWMPLSLDGLNRPRKLPSICASTKVMTTPQAMPQQKRQATFPISGALAKRSSMKTATRNTQPVAGWLSGHWLGFPGAEPFLSDMMKIGRISLDAFNLPAPSCGFDDFMR